MKVDYHIHTNLSDGECSPEEVVKRAKVNGCTEISITDHDVAGAYPQLEQKYDIKIIPGIEFNSSIRNMHILGYGMKDVDSINRQLTKIRLQNEKICLQVIKLLHDDGYDVSLEQVKEYLEAANLNTEIIDKRKLVKYLMYKGYSDSVINTYNTLIGPGQKYYVPNVKLSPKEIFDMIDKAGGISVIAHPNTLGVPLNELQKRLATLQENGLIGMEIINNRNTLPYIDMFSMIADNLSLIKTVGSDFHSPSSEEIGIEVDEMIPKAFNQVLTKKKGNML